MTKKDFELIAATIKAQRHSGLFPVTAAVLDSIDALSLSMADALKATNKQFNRDKFVRACGCISR